MLATGSVAATAARIALGLEETRRDLGLSVRQVAQLAGVSPATVHKLEAGRNVQPALVIRVATALTITELHTPQKPDVTFPSVWAAS